MRWNGAPQLVDRLAWSLTSTWTYHLYGSDHLREACRRSPTGTAMLILWHRNLLLLAGGVCGQGMRIAALVSRSGDGALIAVHLERRGVRTIRGSSHRGAAIAAKELLVAAREGYHQSGRNGEHHPQRPERIVPGRHLPAALRTDRWKNPRS